MKDNEIVDLGNLKGEPIQGNFTVNMWHDFQELFVDHDIQGDHHIQGRTLCTGLTVVWLFPSN